VRAWREAPSEDSALLLARSYFPEFSGDVEPEARKAPLNPATALRVRLADREHGELELATRGYVFRVRPQGGSTAAASRQAPGTTFYGPRHFWKAVGGQAVGQEGLWLTQRVEEFVVAEAGADTYRASYEVEVPEGIHTLRDAGEYLEFLDSRDVPVVRMHYPVARDEAGRSRQGTVRLWGATPQGRGGPGNLPRLALERRTLKVELEVGQEGLEGPVVVDPGWSTTSELAAARHWHTATLLLNGKVLVTGGTSPTDFSGRSYSLSSSELYDPVTGTWSATGSLAMPLSDHTATLLLDGKVLVTGGESNGASFATTQLYDPATGSWSTTGSMATARYWHTATLLNNGKVLVVGGSGNSDNNKTAELYDPATGTWSPTGSQTQGSIWHTATLLPNGKVLVAGGFNISRVDLYDPATGTWSATSTLGGVRYWHTATLLTNGKVLVVGGSDGSNALASAVLYDPATGTWSGTGAPANRRDQHAAALLPDGRVLVVSGYDHSNFGGQLIESELYNPATGTWSGTGVMAKTRQRHTSTLLPNGAVLVTGGITTGGTTANTELYFSAAGSWRTTGPLATARTGHTTTLLPSGKVLVAGGQNASGLMSSAELYDPAAGTWSNTGALATARSHHAATLLPAGKVLVTGGDGTSGPLTSAELYDPVAGTWSTTGTLATARSWHTATLLPSGKVLVTGGNDTSGPLLSAELYAPAAGTWSSTGSLTTARAHHTATLLPSGKVLVAGGQASSETLGSAELYDPSAGTFSVTGTLTAARTDHTATLLPSGKVLLVGGSGASGPQAGAELYDSAAGTFSAAAPLTTARSRHVAIPLPSGNVLVAAGLGTTGRLASAEVYNPLVGTFSTVGSLAAARADASVTLLPRGKVLVAGGSVATGALASAEVYEEAGAPDAWRPLVTPPSSLQAGQTLTLSGSGFRGLSEASGYGTSSATNYPLVSLTSLECGRRTQLSVQRFSDTSIVVSVPSVGDGYSLLNVTTNAISGGVVVFVDGPPPAPVLTAPAALVNTPTPAIAGTAEAGSTVTVSLDGTPVGTVTADALGDWSLEVTSPLEPGPYTATATATDAVGNTSPSSAPRTFTVDTVAPAAPVLTAPAAFVNSPTPAISGTAEADSTVAVKVDGTPVGTVTANASGDWSLTPTSALGQGVHTATATATDAAGNTSSASAPRTFTVDTVGPAAPVLTAPAALVTTTTPVISGTAEAGSTVAVTLDGTPLGTVTANASGDWSYTPASPLTQGEHTVTATAADAAGNTSPSSAPRTFTVDTVAPAAPVFTAPAASVNTPTPILSGTAEAGSTVAVTLDGAPLGTVTANASGAWSLTPTSALGQGAHTATATATDAVGNTSPSSAPRTFTVDTVAPAAPVLTAPAALVNSARPALSGTAEADSTVAVKVDGTLVGTVTANASGAWSLIPTSALGQGVHTATATATDAAGNTGSASAPRSFTVDTVGPATPVLTAPAALVTTTTPVISGTAEAGSTVAVRLDGTPLGTVTANASGDWSYTPASPLTQGGHTVTATAADAAGNTSPSPAFRSFTVDTVAPAAPVLTAPAALVTTATPVLSGSAEAGSTVTVLVDGTQVGTARADDFGAWSLTPTSALGQGAHTATATATDAAGNTSATSASRSFTVDSEAPAPPEVLTPTEGAAVKPGELLFSGNAKPNSTVSVMVDGLEVGKATADAAGHWSVNSLYELAQGRHTMTATATDTVGRVSQPSSTRTFTVEPQEEAPGCGCAASPAGGMASPLALLALWLWSRRRLAPR
jgi:N-acetylneuraminic acid mutarotase